MDGYMYSEIPRHLLMFNDTSCLGYMSLNELFSFCVNHTIRDYIAVLSAGMAAVMFIPTAGLATIANITLILVLSLKIRRPRRLEYFGILMAVVDILFINYVGIFHSFPSFGSPWWGGNTQLVQHTSQLACKLHHFLIEFILAARINVILLVTICELTSGSQLTIGCLQIVITILITVIQAAPAFVVFGLYQHLGVFGCRMDPQWASTIHVFFRRHKIFHCLGLIQALCAGALSISLYRLYARNKLILHYFCGISSASSELYLVTSMLEKKLEEDNRNYRIVLLQTCSTCVCRFFPCLGYFLKDYTSPVVDLRSSQQKRIDHLSWMTVLSLTTFSEIVITTFTFLFWYANIPEIQAVTKRPIKMLMRRLFKHDTKSVTTGDHVANLPDWNVVRKECFSSIYRLKKVEKFIKFNFPIDCDVYYGRHDHT